MSNCAARTAAIAALAALAVVACGSSTSPSATAAAAGGGNPAVSRSAGAPTTAPLPAACSLLTAAQVTGLLGGSPARASGTENDFAATYKSCDWLNSPPAGGNATALDIRVFVRASSSAPGFASTIASDGPSSTVSGVGDSASFASVDGTGANLIVNKGLTAISISTQGPAGGASVKSAMVSDVQQVLTEIGA